MNAATNTNAMTSFEWLGRELRAKTASYEVSVSATGEKPPSWDEKLGVFGLMEGDLQKDIAYLLANGDFVETSPERKRIEEYLFKSIFAVADQEKKYKKDELPKICRLIAKMELFFFLYDFLEDDYTLQGRLRFAGLLHVMTVKAYQNNWKHYGDAAKMLLGEAKDAAQEHIQAYKKKLNIKS
jgi:hypothetical protein